MRAFEVDAAVALEHDLGLAADQLEVFAHGVHRDLAHGLVLGFSDLEFHRLADVGGVALAHHQLLGQADFARLYEPDEGVHRQTHIAAVGQADVHHLGDAGVLHVGDADGFLFVETDVDGLVLADVFRAVVADRDGLVVIDAFLAVLVNRDGLVQIHFFRAPAVHVDFFVAIDDLGAVAVNGVELVPVDDLAAVIAHPFVFVVFDFGELVLLRVQPELLFALLVFKAQGIGVARAVLQAVATGTTDARVGLDPRLRFVAGQVPWRHLHRVVDTSGDDGVVRVAVQEIYDDFLPDPGDVHRAVVAARPGLAHADPAAGVFVFFAVAVPVELDLHAAIFVGVDFLARRAGDHRRLRAGGVRLGGHALAAVGRGFGDYREADSITRRAVQAAAC